MLRMLPAETAHRATLSLLQLGAQFVPSLPSDDPRLAVTVLGFHFPNPIGLAAGFDKDARVPGVMLKLGFGFVECGTLTPRPQAGNPRPRLFRLPEDNAVVNRMGFNNGGTEAAAERLRSRPRHGVLGINIGANRDSTDRIRDYREAFAAVEPFADYVAVNVSSPNTPGLRELQGRQELMRLLEAVTRERTQRHRRVPILLKIAPDISLNELDQIIETALTAGIDGLIVGNTTTERAPSLKGRHRGESGGLSGAPLFAPSTALLKETYRRAGKALALVGVGGVSSGAEAYAKIRAGATLVQLYTAMALRGPGLIGRIKNELLACLARDGCAGIVQCVGADAQ